MIAGKTPRDGRPSSLGDELRRAYPPRPEAWRFDALDPRAGLAFVSWRGSPESENPVDLPSVYLAAPDFRPVELPSRALGLGASRHSFEEGLFLLQGKERYEAAFTILDHVIEFLRRCYLRGAGNDGGDRFEGGGPPAQPSDGAPPFAAVMHNEGGHRSPAATNAAGWGKESVLHSLQSQEPRAAASGVPVSVMTEHFRKHVERFAELSKPGSCDDLEVPETASWAPPSQSPQAFYDSGTACLERGALCVIEELLARGPLGQDPLPWLETSHLFVSWMESVSLWSHVRIAIAHRLAQPTQSLGGFAGQLQILSASDKLTTLFGTPSSTQAPFLASDPMDLLEKLPIPSRFTSALDLDAQDRARVSLQDFLSAFLGSPPGLPGKPMPAEVDDAFCLALLGAAIITSCSEPVWRHAQWLPGVNTINDELSRRALRRLAEHAYPWLCEHLPRLVFSHEKEVYIQRLSLRVRAQAVS